MTGATLSLGSRALRERYAAGLSSPVDVVDEVYERIAARGDDHVWISLVPHDVARATAAALDPADVTRLPLYGLPFAVKDNIDVAGLETTVACPAYAYTAARDAVVVERLRAAGAVLIGKANLDQFATGLNGTRSPYGVPGSAPDPRLIAGGSSSGSGVAVGAGLVSPAAYRSRSDRDPSERAASVMLRRAPPPCRRAAPRRKRWRRTPLPAW